MAWQHISEEDLERYYLGKALKRHRIAQTRSARRSSQAASTWSEASRIDGIVQALLQPIQTSGKAIALSFDIEYQQ
jgi:hypothetical protein